MESHRGLSSRSPSKFSLALDDRQMQALNAYNTLLKSKLISVLEGFDNSVALVNVIHKYSKPTIKLTQKDKDEILTKKDLSMLLDIISDCDNWFSTFLKCLKDKNVKLKHLKKSLKNLEAEVHMTVYGHPSSERENKGFFSKLFSSRNRQTSTGTLEWEEDQRPSSNYTRTTIYDSAESSLDTCPCKLDDTIKDFISSATGMQSNNRKLSNIRDKLDILLHRIQECRQSITVREKSILQYDWKDVLLFICTLKISEDQPVEETRSLFINIKQMAFETFVYLTHSFSSITEILHELLRGKDRFVADMSLFLRAYIYDEKKLIKMLTDEKVEGKVDLVDVLNELLKSFSGYVTYTYITSLQEIEFNAYIEGLVRMASAELLANEMKNEHFLTSLHDLVHKVDKLMIYKSYVGLLSLLGFPQIRDPKKQVNQKLSGDDYEIVDDDEDSITSPSVRKGETQVVIEGTDISTNNHKSWPVNIYEEEKALARPPSDVSHSGTLSILNKSVCTTLLGEEQLESTNSSGIISNDDIFTLIKRSEIPRSAIEMKEEVGSGNFSTVCRGIIYKKLDAAVKVMKHRQRSPSFFFSEAAILIQLEHPNIVQLMAVVTVEEPFYIITEFFPERDLRTFLKSAQGKSLRIEEIVNINKQIVDGMLYIQKRNIVHNDLRIANILFESIRKVKIADFGLAQVLQDNSEHYFDNEDSPLPIKWSSPETVLERKCSFKSDVWSFGIVLFEIITYGNEPYSEYSNSDVKCIMKRGRSMQKPSNRNFQCQEAYSKIIHECWEFSPQGRPTFQQLLDNLRQF